MTATASETVSATDRFGRRTRCVSCGSRLKYAGTGRPRVICGKRECFNAWHRARMRRYHPKREWTAEDHKEAKRLWGGLCGNCEIARSEVIGDTGREPLPMCRRCEVLPLSNRAAIWLDRCVPGCPLPNPFAKGKP